MRPCHWVMHVVLTTDQPRFVVVGESQRADPDYSQLFCSSRSSTSSNLAVRSQARSRILEGIYLTIYKSKVGSEGSFLRTWVGERSTDECKTPRMIWKPSSKSPSPLSRMPKYRWLPIASRDKSFRHW